MSYIVIMPGRTNVTARIDVIEISEVDGIYTLSCSGDGLDECPRAGFAPGDTWGNGYAEAIEAGLIHMGAHERRRCVECGGVQRSLGTGHDGDGEFVERYGCTECDHVEVIR